MNSAMAFCPQTQQFDRRAFSLCSISLVAWDQAPQWGKKDKKMGQIGKTSASKASPAEERERAAEPEDMTLMPLFHDTKLYHPLIGQMS